MFALTVIPVETKTELTEKLIENIRKNYESDVHIMEIASMLEKKVKEIRKANVPREFVEITNEMKKADQQRDNALRAIVYTCQAAVLANLPGAEMAEEFLKNIIPDGMRFLIGSIHAESDILRNRINYLQKPENSSAVEQLNLSPLIEALVAAQLSFDKLFLSREGKSTGIPETPLSMSKRLDGNLRLLHSWLSEVYGAAAVKSEFATMMEASHRFRSMKNHPENPAE